VTEDSQQLVVNPKKKNGAPISGAPFFVCFVLFMVASLSVTG
jgi:hypothetical protein